MINTNITHHVEQLEKIREQLTPQTCGIAFEVEPDARLMAMARSHIETAELFLLKAAGATSY